MSLTVFEGLQSEIYVPITPKSIFTPVTKPLSEMVIALASACGAHLKTDKRFNLAGDTTYREIPDNTPTDDLMISHGGYDNSDANRDINCMFRSIVSMNWLKPVSLKVRLRPTSVSWAVAVTRPLSMIRRVRKLLKSLKTKMLTALS